MLLYHHHHHHYYYHGHSGGILPASRNSACYGEHLINGTGSSRQDPSWMTVVVVGLQHKKELAH